VILSSVLWIRKSDKIEETIIIVCNFADATQSEYRIGVPLKGKYKEIFNSQSKYYEGWNIGNTGILKSEKIIMHNRENSITLTLPPLGVIYLKFVGNS